MGVVKKETLFNANSSTVVQHSCENSMAVAQLNSVKAQLRNSTAMKQHECEVALGYARRLDS